MGNPGFTFYEGPPTANGRPGIHHVMARTLKDLVCRYKTMKGFQVHRKAGWDTHGLPVEIEVEKQLGFKHKDDIVKYGVAEFNAKCRESVWKYKTDWEQMTEQMGYWVDLHDPYVTFENNYIESIWWALKRFYDEGLMYKGYKIQPYCPRCETPLSSHEVSQGYEDVKDQSVYVRMRLKSDPTTSFLVWTTTPWTLISNVALAVGPGVDYVKVSQNGENLILAEARLAALQGSTRSSGGIKGAISPVGNMTGSSTTIRSTRKRSTSSPPISSRSKTAPGSSTWRPRMARTIIRPDGNTTFPRSTPSTRAENSGLTSPTFRGSSSKKPITTSSGTLKSGGSCISVRR